jgi:hypothetical protein
MHVHATVSQGRIEGKIGEGEGRKELARDSKFDPA